MVRLPGVVRRPQSCLEAETLLGHDRTDVALVELCGRLGVDQRKVARALLVDGADVALALHLGCVRRQAL